MRNSGGRESGQKHHQFNQFEGRKGKVVNQQTLNGVRLNENEYLRMIFHPLNVRNITRPKLKNGNRICNRFHSVDFCFMDCRKSEGHADLDKEETGEYVKYVQAARAARTAFQQRKVLTGDSKKSNEEAQQKEPNGSKAGA